MNARRLLVGSAFVIPVVVSSSGCDVAVTVLQDETVQQALGWVAHETFTYVMNRIVIPAVNDIVKPAEAKPLVNPERPLTCAGLANDRSLQGDVQACTKGAEAGAAIVVDEALRDVQQTPVGQTVDLKFACKQHEDRTTCTDRFRGLLKDAAAKRAQDSLVVARAQSFADAWPGCREQVLRDKNADSVSRVVAAANACMESRGFQAEIAAIKLVYSGSKETA